MEPDRLEFARVMGAAAVHEISERVCDGQNFFDAKNDSTREMMRKSGLSGPDRELVWTVLNAIQPEDLPRQATDAIAARNLRSIEEYRGYKAGRIEQWFYNLTGYVFRV